MRLFKSVLPILCLLFSLNVSAQKVILFYGEISKAVLEMKECPFDKSAENLVLFDSSLFSEKKEIVFSIPY